MGYRYEQCYEIEQDRYMMIAGLLVSLGLSLACYSASNTNLAKEMGHKDDQPDSVR